MNTTASSPPKSHTRYVVLLGALIVQLILGTVYGYSIFWGPLSHTIYPDVITQQQAEELPADKDVSQYTVVADEEAVKAQIETEKGYLKYSFSICILTFAMVMVIAGRVQDVMGPRFPAIAGAILMGGGFIMAGLINNPIVFYLGHAAFTGGVTIVLLMLFYALFGKIDTDQMPILKAIPPGIITACVLAGMLLSNLYNVENLGGPEKLFLLLGTIGFLAGAGIGFAYVCPIAALVKWFPKQKGLVSGLAVAGFGLGAFLFSSKNFPFSAENYLENHEIIDMFLLHGAICLGGIIIGAMMLKNPPGTATATIGEKTNDSSWQDTIKRPSFYVLWLMYFSGSLAGLMVIGILKGFAGDQLIAAASKGGEVLTEATKMDLISRGVEAVAWLAIFNAVGRVVWGFVSDRIGRTISFVLMFIFQAGTLFFLGTLDTEMSLIVGASIIGFNYGGNFALFPSVTADLFGAKNLGANYGWVFTSYGIAGVVGIAAGNAAMSMYDSYNIAFSMAGVLCLISAALAIWLALSRKFTMS